jgi:hypothetical protein
MKTAFRQLLWPLVFLPWAEALGTDDPPPAKTTGHVLVLDNARLLEGDIDKAGDQYRIRRPVGETWIQANKVKYLCDTREQAYAYFRSRINLQDADERLRLARWCQMQGLCEQALAEVAAAVELRPQHVESRRLMASLQRSAAEKCTPVAKAPVPAELPPMPLPALDVTAECVNHFNTRVQPILMNACASCHAAAGKGGNFKLIYTFDNDTIDRKSVQQNLAAALAQLNPDQPQSSKLLVNAITQHGTMVNPPFKDRQAKPYKMLEEWVYLSTGKTAPSQEKPSTAAVADAKPLFPGVGEKAESKPATEPVVPKPEPAAPKPAAVPPAKPDSGFATTPRQNSDPADPYDPAVFNREVKKPK